MSIQQNEGTWPAIRVKVRGMLADTPQLHQAKVIKVGPHYTIEKRADLGKWEVKYGEGHFGLYNYLDFAFEAIARADDEVTIPQDVSMVPEPKSDVMRTSITKEDLDEVKAIKERLDELMDGLDYAIGKADRNLIHNSARNVRCCAGAMERCLKGMR